MKKILVNYLGVDGSGPVFTLEMVKGLSENGYEIYAILSDNIENKLEWEKAIFIKDILFVPTHKSKAELLANWIRYQFVYGLTAKKRFENEKFDAVLRTFPHPMLNATERFLKIKKNITICHDPTPHSGEVLLAKIRNYLIMKDADVVLVLTKKFIPYVTQRYRIDAKNIYYMPHGKMSQYKVKQQLDSLINFHSDCYYFVFFGRIEDYKGLKVLGEAFAKLEHNYDNVELVVAGNGDFSRYKEQYENIQHLSLFNRYISNEEVGTFFDSNSVIAVVPYIDATQSGVIPIALEYGNPIIASNTGGLVEQLDNGNVGVLVDAGSSESLYRAMEKLIVNREEFIKQSKLSKDYSEKLSWKNVTDFFKSIV